MRIKTFILLILLLLVGAAAVVLLFMVTSGGSVANLLGGNSSAETTEQNNGTSLNQEPNEPPPTATPSFEPVVVAKVRLPIGEIISEELLAVEYRPITNIALQGGYTFTSTEQLVGRIVKAEISRGQEILGPMLALNPSDISAFGSDLSLYVPFGQVAVALPVDRFSAASLAMRPGDKIDIVMTLRAIEIDSEFQSPLPNNVGRVIESALVNGQGFLFPNISEGRLEFVPELNQVAGIIPGGAHLTSQDWEVGAPVPKRVTQLTVQQATVLYVGQWVDPLQLEREQEIAQAAYAATQEAMQGSNQQMPVPTPTPIPSRLEETPGMVIISMSGQDALALKYARERGVDITLVLRAPGDQTQFVTTSVSLPQIIDQGGLGLPDIREFELFDPEQPTSIELGE